MTTAEATGTTELALTLTFHADWHVGSGFGRPGDVDRLVQRDGDGLPYVPAKTLTGVWRDACERVALGLDEGEPAGGWQELVTAVFGSAQAGETRGQAGEAVGNGAARTAAPRPAALSVRPLRLSPPLRAALAPDVRRPARDACTLVRPGVRVDPDTGQARPQFLRFEEVARRGLRLHGLVELDLDGDATAALALLAAGAVMVERLGGKRRRGAGRCTLDVGLDTQERLDWLAQHPQPPDGQATTVTSGRATPTPVPSSSTAGVATRGASSETAPPDGEWSVVDLRLTTHTPVVAAAATVGNVVESLDYVPGRLLLPRVAAVLADAGIDVGEAIARGELVVTDAVPGIDGRAGRRSPAALSVEKGRSLSEGPVYNRLIEPAPPGVQMAAVRGGWIDEPGRDRAPVRVTTPMQVATHNTIFDATQRPTSDVGGVYTYEAIAADTELHAQVRVTDRLAGALAAHAVSWHDRLSGTWRLGRSRKDDYAQVKVDADAPAVVPQPGDDVAARCPAAGQELVVWLFSDTLVLDGGLRAHPTVDAVAAALADALGVAVRPRASDAGLVDAAVWVHRTEGWQTRWGLPRPSVPAVGSGSCFVAVVDDAVTPEAMAAAEAGGIGQRRAEGHGQVRLNDPLLTSAATARHPSRPASGSHSQATPPPAPRLADDDPDADIAAMIETAAWRARIRDAAERLAAVPALVHDLLGWTAEKPPASQLGGLQAALMAGEDLQPVRAWRQRMLARENRRNKWPGDSLERLRKLLDGDPPEHNIWQVLELAGDVDDCVLHTDAEQRLRRELHDEAARTLLLAALRHHRRYLERAMGDDDRADNGDDAELEQAGS